VQRPSAKGKDVFVLVKSSESVKSFDSDDESDLFDQQESSPVNTLADDLNVNDQQETTLPANVNQQETTLPANANQQETTLPANANQQETTLLANNQSTNASISTIQPSDSQQALVAAISQQPNNIIPLISNLIQMITAASSNTLTASTSLLNTQNITTISRQPSQANEVSSLNILFLYIIYDIYDIY
jgi:hypothetical protein